MLEQIALFVKARGWNVYDLAMIRHGKAECLQLQPCNRCNDSYSVAKAFTMTAVGMLWDEGRLSLDGRLTGLLGAFLPTGYDGRWNLATVDHALSHRLGLAPGMLDIDVDDVSAYGTQDYLQYVFSQAPECAPGERYAYTDAAYYLLSRVAEAVTGRTLDAFLTERLFAPLGFSEVAWSHCPQGHTMGATGLYISARDMVKLAWLYRMGGVWEGRRLLSEEWIRTVRERRYEIAPLGRETGWLGKGGMHGQMMAYSPALDAAVAWHAFDRRVDHEALLSYIQTLCAEEEP